MLTSTSLELRVYIGGGRRRVCCPRRENAGKICLQVGLGSVHHQVQPLYLGRPPQICTNLNSSPLMFISCWVGLGVLNFPITINDAFCDNSPPFPVPSHPYPPSHQTNPMFIFLTPHKTSDFQWFWTKVKCRW